MSDPGRRRRLRRLVAGALLLGAAGCGDFLFSEEPGVAAIRATYKTPVTDAKQLGAVCDRLGDSDGVSQTSCSTVAAVFVFDEKATASQVGALSLELRRMDAIDEVLVSVVGDDGQSVVRP